jgi:hypothetical protein
MTANSATLSMLLIRTKRDLARLTFKPETTSKHNKRTRTWRRWLGLASQKTKVSSANKCEILTIGSLELTEMPKRQPLSTVIENILLKASMMTTNGGFVEKMSYCYQGSPSFILTCKLQSIKLNLKKWNEVFGNADLLVSHLLFVDDTLIFCEVDPNHLRPLRCLFLCFETVSWLEINLI